MNKHQRDILAAPRERTTSHETESCKRCRTPLHFATDGMGYLVPQCPHCDWGFRAPRARPVMPQCEHGVAVDDTCGYCIRKRHAIRDGLRAYHTATHKRATYAAERAAVAAKGWATRRKSA